MKIRIPLITAQPLSEDIAVDQMNQAIKKLVASGAFKGNPDDFLKDYVVNLDVPQVTIEIDDEAYVDGLQLSAVGASPSAETEYDAPAMKVDIESYGTVKLYSVATITERLKLSQRQPKQQMRMMILDYMKYYKNKKETLLGNTELFKSLQRMFLNDLMGLFNVILPEIMEGKQLNQLLGVSQVSPKLTQIATKLSRAYRIALKTEQQQGAPSKNQFVQLAEYYKEFITELMNIVFPENKSGSAKAVKPLLKTKTKTQSRIYSLCSDGRIDLFSKPFSNMIPCDWDDGIYEGDYDDFTFIPKNKELGSLRFDESSFGDTEFNAIVEVTDGYATIHREEDCEFSSREYCGDGRIKLF